MARVSSFRTFAFCLLPFAFFGCARPAFVLPSGTGTPAPEARSAWTEASGRCGSARSITAELRISGRAGSQGRIRARALAGVTAAGQIRLEVPAPFGRPVFVLAGSSERATLLSRDDAALTARADEILEALVGLSLEPAALVALLSGCGLREPPAGEPVRFGELVAVGAAGNRVFLESIEGRWRVAAAELPGWVVDYRTGRDGWPTRIRVRSTADRKPEVALSIDQSQVEVDAPIPASAFSIAVPAGASRMTLDDLRAAGPLGEKQ